MKRVRSGAVRRGQFDAVVVGAGVVGSATALGLARQGLRVALIEARAPRRWNAEDARDLRVFAFAPGSSGLLAQLGAWDAVQAARAHPYVRMRVWDAADAHELSFDSIDAGVPALGHIVEQSLLQHALWAQVETAPSIQTHCPASVVALEREPELVNLQLDNGARVSARFVVAADGSDSSLRELAGFETTGRSYAQRGLVAYVRCEQSHQNTAWQRFLPGGPLALLPCDAELGSIVWTLPEAEAGRLLQSDDAVFEAELTRAFDARLGTMRLASPRAGFPLRLQLASAYERERVVLVGDAAHVVHPLAGQGVNLGLQDTIALLQAVARDLAAAREPGTHASLRAYARARRSDNALAAYAFDGLNRLFSNQAFLPTLLRGPALGMVDRLGSLKRWFARNAAGVQGSMGF